MNGTPATKIAISASGPSMDAAIDERFGRCPFFVIVDPDGTAIEPLDNPCAVQGHGAGIQAAKLVAEKGVGIVLTGRCGPNASDTLGAAGIKVITGCAGTVRQVFDTYQAGNA